MSKYRLYYIGDDGFIIGHAEWVSDSDAAAVRQAERLKRECAMELRWRDRVIKRFPSDPEPAPAADSVAEGAWQTA